MLGDLPHPGCVVTTCKNLHSKCSRAVGVVEMLTKTMGGYLLRGIIFISKYFNTRSHSRFAAHDRPLVFCFSTPLCPTPSVFESWVRVLCLTQELNLRASLSPTNPPIPRPPHMSRSETPVDAGAVVDPSWRLTNVDAC